MTKYAFNEWMMNHILCIDGYESMIWDIELYVPHICINVCKAKIWNIEIIIVNICIPALTSHLIDDHSETRDNVIFSISEYDIYKELEKIKSISSGFDGITGFIHRKFAIRLAFPLSLIFNKALVQCKFPSEWKKALVIPIPKGKTQFRPISLISMPSKLFKKFIMAQMIPNLEQFCKLNQFAFIPGRHCGTANALLYTWKFGH